MPQFAIDLMQRGAQGGGLTLNEGRGNGRQFAPSSALSSGTSEPELSSIQWHAIATMEAPSERTSLGAAIKVPSVASDSSLGDVMSKEREQALVRTLDSVGIVFPPRLAV